MGGFDVKIGVNMRDVIYDCPIRTTLFIIILYHLFIYSFI